MLGKSLKVLVLVMLASVSAGYWLYVWTPDFDAKIEQELTLAEQEFAVLPTAYDVEAERILDQIDGIDLECTSTGFGVPCLEKDHSGLPEVNPLTRPAFRRLLRDGPYGDYHVRQQSPPLQLLIRGQSWDYHEDLKLAGRILENTVAYNMAESGRLVVESGNLIGLMIAFGLQSINERAANSAMAKSTGLNLDIEPLVVPIETIERVTRGEWATSYRFVSTYEDPKWRWVIEELRWGWTNLIAHYRLPDNVYWTSLPTRELNFRARFLNRDYGLDEVPEVYLGYFDHARLAHLNGILLLALQAIYSGTSPEAHGVDAPTNWSFQWRPETSMLCLIPDFQTMEGRNAHRCLPNLKYQMAQMKARNE